MLQMAEMSIEGDNDNDHSSSQLSVRKGLTSPEGQGAWAFAHSPFGETLAACNTELFRRFLCSNEGASEQPHDV